ncbi:uncharacterized protein G2W53_011535 [Senna tora]|uniref:Uncharacterized protein n=1 Tax=Senna tora TaxID=362788 RepID=A0A834X1X1_9FABA|nr:uncharacterized protein G2W53_011535 [Senna tora]
MADVRGWRRTATRDMNFFELGHRMIWWMKSAR